MTGATRSRRARSVWWAAIAVTTLVAALTAVWMAMVGSLVVMGV